MPTYNYKCKQCSIEFSVFQSMSAKQLKICKDCGGNIYRKITGGTGLIFKGSGFHLTDYPKKKLINKDSSKQNDTSEKESKVSTKEGNKL